MAAKTPQTEPIPILPTLQLKLHPHAFQSQINLYFILRIYFFNFTVTELHCNCIWFLWMPLLFMCVHCKMLPMQWGNQNILFALQFMNSIQHCFICSPSDSTMSQCTVFKPGPLQRLHWQPDALTSVTTSLDLINIGEIPSTFNHLIQKLQHVRTESNRRTFPKGEECVIPSAYIFATNYQL